MVNHRIKEILYLCSLVANIWKINNFEKYKSCSNIWMQKLHGKRESREMDSVNPESALFCRSKCQHPEEQWGEFRFIHFYVQMCRTDYRNAVVCVKHQLSFTLLFLKGNSDVGFLFHLHGLNLFVMFSSSSTLPRRSALSEWDSEFFPAVNRWHTWDSFFILVVLFFFPGRPTLQHFDLEMVLAPTLSVVSYLSCPFLVFALISCGYKESSFISPAAKQGSYISLTFSWLQRSDSQLKLGDQ